MRRVAATLIVLGLATACSGGGGNNAAKQQATNTNSACGLVAKLDTIAASIAHADVSDPAAFKTTLQTAVTEYADTLRRLAPLMSPDVRSDVERVEASVKQYRFEEAQGERASIDTYARTNCGRTPVTLPANVTTTSIT